MTDRPGIFSFLEYFPGTSSFHSECFCWGRSPNPSAGVNFVHFSKDRHHLLSQESVVCSHSSTSQRGVHFSKKRVLWIFYFRMSHVSVLHFIKFSLFITGVHFYKDFFKDFILLKNLLCVMCFSKENQRFYACLL